MRSSGRRPRFSEWKPTHGARMATTTCGTMIRPDIHSAAWGPSDVARFSPISGSIEASASWNSTVAAMNSASLRFLHRSKIRVALAISLP